MTISQFLELNPSDISKMDYEERKSLVDEMSKKANRRLERLSKLPLPTPAFTNRAEYEVNVKEDETPYILRNEDGSFRYRPFQSTGKNNNQLANELKFLKSFLESSTSTVTGAKRSTVRLYEHLMEGQRATYNQIAEEMSYEKTKDFWEAYNKILQTNAGIISTRNGVTPGYISSSQVQEWIMKTMKDKEDLTPDEIEAMSRSFVKEAYEKNVGKPRSAREYTTGRSRRNRKS